MPIIQTQRLTLRPFALSDLHSTYAYASDAGNIRHMIYLPHKTLADTERFLQRAAREWRKQAPLAYEFALMLGQAHIGGVSVELDESRQQGELGWVIHRDYQSQGYATEAAKAVLGFAFDTLKLPKAVAHCDARNEASYRVMQKIGLLLESTSGVRRYPGSNEVFQEIECALMRNEYKP